jgi:glycerol-3-phosphate O-acyltransferase 3/4
MYYAYYRMTRWLTPVDVVYCEPESPRRGETAVQYSDRIKDIIANSVGLEKVDFNGMAKRELLKALIEENEAKKEV